jgi:hypothetical protein
MYRGIVKSKGGIGWGVIGVDADVSMACFLRLEARAAGNELH